MFLRRPVWSLRTRLTGILAFTVSVALGIVFVLVNFYLRDQALNRRFEELRNIVTRISKEDLDQDALREEKEDYPGIELYVFGRHGQITASTTKNAPPLSIGAHKSGEQLSFGVSHHDRITIGTSSWSETNTGLKQLSVLLLLLWFLLTLVTALVAWYGGGLVLQPVKELVASAEKLSGLSTGQKLHTTDTAEFAALADRLNQLIARVHDSAILQEQFASDAAHEMRNPLAILRTRIEANLMKERSVADHVESQQRMLNQVDRLTAIVESLLRSARQLDQEAAAIDVGSTLTETVANWIELNGWPPEQLKLSFEPCFAKIQTDELAIIVGNLLDNARRHSPTGSSIDVSVRTDGHQINLTIRDYGSGIHVSEFERVFDRFYRSDESRNRAHGGAGIGLAVVKRIVEARGGSVYPQQVPVGTLMVVSLPSETV